jgi:hypothetical protein
MSERERIVEDKSPTERVSEILDNTADEIKQIIAETLAGVKVFPKTRLGKLDNPNSWTAKGTVKNLPGIWVNWEDFYNFRSDKDPFILTRKGLFKSSFYFCDDDQGWSRRMPVINRLEEPSKDEYLKWGYKALSVLEEELERQKENAIQPAG